MGYLPANLKHLRSINQLKQLEVSIKLNAKYKTYQAWENGYGTPNYEALDKISKLYRVNYQDLVMTDLTTVQPKQTAEHYFITKYNLAPNNIKQAIDKLLGI